MDDDYSKEPNSSGDNFGDEHLRKKNLSGSNASKEIRKAVEECLLASSSTLDVSRKNVKHLTEEIYRPPNIKYFHLEGNVISTIPEDLFQKLPHLVWLDLRYNKIKALPPGIGFHRQLKTLLLERNPIKELPAELVYFVNSAAVDISREVMANGVVNHMKPKYKLSKVVKGQSTCQMHAASLAQFGDVSPCWEKAGLLDRRRNLTSLTALNLRHCPLEFPPKHVIQKGLKSILGFLRDSGNGEVLCMEPATSAEVPPVEKLNLSELLQSSLDLSEEWPNEEEKLRFQELKEEIINDEKEEFLADKHVGAIHDFTEAGKKHRKKKQLCADSPSLCRTIWAKRAGKCRSVAEKELREEQALFDQRKNNKEVLQEWCSQAKLMKEKKEMFRFSPTKADTIPGDTPYATDDIGDYAMKEGAEKRGHIPAKMEERLLKVKVEAAKYLREQKLEQRLKQHMHMMKARGEKLKGTSQVEVKGGKQGTGTVEDLQTKLTKPKAAPRPQEYRLTAFTGELPPHPPGTPTPQTFSSSKF